MDGGSLKHPCDIRVVGKSRSGKSRYWCVAHGASATGRYGVRLPQCESAYRDVDLTGCFELDADSFPGGVAIWGAVAPVYDTSAQPDEPGVHVHARSIENSSDKKIDGTYPAVSVMHHRDLVEGPRPVFITQEAAINYFLSKTFDRPINHLFCIHCGEVHLDAGFYAVKSHKRHLCHGCGKYFIDEKRGVSNPVTILRERLGDSDARRKIVHPERTLDINQRDFPGGIKVWASNPAIVWTAEKPEEEGIHVHIFASPTAETPYIDETFGAVRIDGVLLNEHMVRILMAQRALKHLENKIVALDCPKCGEPHFDVGDNAVFPHKKHHCDACGAHFHTPGKRPLVVSNPLIRILDGLLPAAPRQNSRKG